MTRSRLKAPVSRRTALAGLGAGGLGIVLSRPHLASARGTEDDMASHPLVGTWLAGKAPNDISVTHWSPDGNMSGNGTTVAVGADGALTHQDPAMGSWVPEGERQIHFIFTYRTYDATGALTGTFTVEGHPIASEDGMSFWDDGTRVTVTIRDPNGAVVQQMRPGLEGAGIGGVRLVPGESGYDEMLAMLAERQTASPEGGTPVS